MQSLPLEVLERIVIFAGQDLKDVGRCALVCVSWAAAASKNQRVFRALAHAKYGHEIATLSEPCYANSDWKALMLDDNKRGALPTLARPILCQWRYNQTRLHYCCIIQCVKWYRHTSELRLYLDVRGESDLRHPMGSTINYVANERQRTWGEGRPWGFSRWEGSSQLVPIRFVEHEEGEAAAVVAAESEAAAVPPSSNCHFKGHLVFAIHNDFRPGTFTFSYANRQFGGRIDDYHSQELFSIQTTLADTFRVNNDPCYRRRRRTVQNESTTNGAATAAMAAATAASTGSNNDFDDGVIIYTADVSPFADDTPDVEKSRWDRIVPSEVMNRRSRPWYI